MKIGILGCGVISNTYIQEIKRLYQPLLEIAAVAGRNTESTRAAAEKYEIPAAYTVDELLADPEIELVVNLTPPCAHVELNRRILEADKHLFCEKPFALSVEDAKELAALAEKKGLLIGAAPDTFLTAPMQSCRKLLEEGWIGKPLYATANMMSCGVETWHPSPQAFYQQGGGPLFDMAPYYLSVLIHLFGPVQEVFSYGAKGYEERRIYSQPLAGTSVKVEIPTHYTSVLKMKNGVLVNMNMSFDIWHSTLPKLELYGTEGTMTMPDPNMSDGRPCVFRKEQVLAGCYGLTADAKSYELPLRNQSVSAYTRGCGVAEMALAIRDGRKNRANEQMAIHIVEVINRIMESAGMGRCCRIESECAQPGLWEQVW
ncbi:MAG: Gfo/Idh/MocA family oxidoreductase [Lachnospiraceae bacterium]|nr:Gfo/Idh/MocA family oxidoreductase [Lachnospiraceae bacterium]